MQRAHVLVICARRYNGHELWTLLGILQKTGCTFEVVSQDTTIRDEKTLRPNKIRRRVDQITKVDIATDFDAIAVVSGNTQDTEKYWDDKHVAQLLKTAREHDKIVGGICCAVPTLATVVKDVKVSFFPLIRCRDRLLKGGAILQSVSLTVDKKTVTAENQALSIEWSEEIVNLVRNPQSPPLYNYRDSGFSPKGLERMMPKEVRAAIEADKRDKGLPPMVIRKRRKT